MSTGRWPVLSEKNGQRLVKLARDTIALELGLEAAEARAPSGARPAEPWLSEPAATFVTIHRCGELHGCVGSIEPRRPLFEDVRHNARAAALHDPRALPICAGDLDDLSIEVSLLGALEPIQFTSERDALTKLRPHEDGVVFACGGRRATFLPQVWKSLPSPAEFMTRLKLKAGFPADFWSPDVKLWRYALQKWSEEDAGRPAFHAHGSGPWS
jgi:AmmeMemoRadiSam system protein A